MQRTAVVPRPHASTVTARGQLVHLRVKCRSCTAIRLQAHGLYSETRMTAAHYLRTPRRARSSPVVLGALLALLQAPAGAADLQPATSAAFDRYARATEAERAAGPFLWIDGTDPERRRQRERVHGGGLLIEALQTRPSGRAIPVPDGLVHHWLGVVFVPGATVEQAVALLQDYDRHDEIYRPNVARSRLVARNGDSFRVFLRFFMKKVLTVVVNSDHDAQFTRISPTAAQSRVISTRIAEVENPDTPDEREKPVGRDGGYLWRLNSYWRFAKRDGGVFVQCESISLTRGIPFGLGWAVGPFVTSIPRETLTFTLETTRRTLQAAARR